jgi:hypothetical protein
MIYFAFVKLFFFWRFFSGAWLPDGFSKAHRWRLHRRRTIERWRMP